jgi:hypothetical protein
MSDNLRSWRTLDEHTDPGVRFFGIQMEVVRIVESLPAPVLNVLSQPNDWQKQVRSATADASTGGKSALYVTFWTKFLERIHREHPNWTRARRPQTVNWLQAPIVRVGCRACGVASVGRASPQRALHRQRRR